MLYLDKLNEIEEEYEKLIAELGNKEVIKDIQRYRAISKAKAELDDIVQTYKLYKKIINDIAAMKELLEDKDQEIRALAREELKGLEKQKEEIEDRLIQLMLPKDKNDEKNVILEIRAGTGGEEACLFAGDLFRMYTRYAEKKRWKWSVVSFHDTGLGGFKEVIIMIEGTGVYSKLKYESGVHRVQRIPITEASGRIHTSAVTVAVLPEAEEIDVKIDENDLKIDVFSSSGPGGQHVNKSQTAIRITHIPTGIVVTCQDERSQYKNKSKALKVLRARLLDMAIKQQELEQSIERRNQVGSGDRSEKIRTYNFPQNRVTDHRINLSLYKLESILNGELDELIEALISHYQAESMKQARIAQEA
jgi:peptide chain release factor 1